MVLKFYEEVQNRLEEVGSGVLLVVTHHSGSSPGRQGFHLFVHASGMTGTIGGGIMEHKLVELSKDLIGKGPFKPFIKNQLHHQEATGDRSGMICSGEQTIAFYYLNRSDLKWVNEVTGNKKTVLCYTENGIFAHPQVLEEAQFRQIDKKKWRFDLPVQPISKVFVIGGGHVGLALCRTLSVLEFEIHLLDNRAGLNTFEDNQYAHFKKIVNYEAIESYIPEGPNIYVVIISFGYRTDKVVLKRLLGKDFRFLGMMGSQNKIRILWEELLEEGSDPGHLENVISPIGMDIKSETTHEIAISIAAQLIQWKNKGR